MNRWSLIPSALAVAQPREFDVAEQRVAVLEPTTFPALSRVKRKSEPPIWKVSRATGLNSSSARGASLARTIKPSLPGVTSKTAIGSPL